MSLTFGQQLEAQRLRAAKQSWNQIAKAIGAKREAVRKALDKQYGDRQAYLRRIRDKAERERERDLRAMLPGSAAKNQEPGVKFTVPQDVLADRSRREQLKWQDRDMTAALCGDPLPGYSALDQRK
jgi:hypothetical protein